MKVIKNVSYDNRYPECILDIYLPDINPSPVFIYFHGGGLESGSKEEISEDLKQLPNHNIALVSVGYRLYPQAKYPDFILDVAKAINFIKEYNKDKQLFSDIYVGGTSAGGYLAMMLYFDRRYLGEYGIDPDEFKGWVFDAGQPTVHFNVLRERGLDTRLVRIDEGAPLYFINKDIDNEKQTKLLFIVAEHDLPNRYEQTMLLLKTLDQFNYDMTKVKLVIMLGYNHATYSICEEVNKFIKGIN